MVATTKYVGSFFPNYVPLPIGPDQDTEDHGGNLTGKETMMRFCGIMIVCILVVACAGDGKLSGPTSGKGDSGSGESRVFSRAELLADFRQLGRLLETRHPRPYTGDRVLEELISDTESSIQEGMTEAEFNRLLAPLIVAMKCGHTSLSMSRAAELSMRQAARYLPLRVQLEEGRLVVVEESGTGERIPLLSEIRAIDGVPASRIIERLLAVTTADGDNLTKKTWVVSRWFPSLYRLHFGERAVHEIEFMPPAGPGAGGDRVLADGSPRKMFLDSRRLPEFDVTMHTLHLPRPGSGPLYSARILHTGTAATDNDERTVTGASGESGRDTAGILRIASFSPGSLKDFKAFLASFFRELEYSGARTLVIDLRGNFGGDARAAMALLGHLSGEAFPYFDAGLPFYFYAILGREVKPAAPAFRGRVLALVDGACFSTTGHFLSILKDRKMGILIGEETGGSRVVTDGSFDATLRNTGLRLHCASRIIATLAPSLPAGRGIGPDFEVVTRAQDRVGGIDPVMDRALEMAGVVAAGHT